MRVLSLAALLAAGLVVRCEAQSPPRRISDYPSDAPASSWDDLTAGLQTAEDWQKRRAVLQDRFLELIRDQHKPPRPPHELVVHETATVDGVYERRLVSYRVESDERAHAYIAVPLQRAPGIKLPAVVVLHGTNKQGIEQAAGLTGEPHKAFLDHLCRRGYVVIAPEHFVSGRRTPPEGPYDTTRFYQRRPNWTAVGKFTFEHSIAIDILAEMDEVDPERIGVLGHSLGGQGAMFLAAYDSRIKAAVSNCAASFFRHNERVKHWARDQWYVYFQPMRGILAEGELPPIDFHEIMALIAPRAFLDVSGLNDGDPRTQRHRLLMLASVARVYDLLDASSELAFFVHGYGHAAPPESHAVMYAWLDGRLRAQESAAPDGNQR